MRYFQIPLMLIQGAHKDLENCKQKIISFAIVDFALKQDVSEQDQARQALYNYYRDGGLKSIRHDMFKAIEELESKHELFIEPDYCFFSNPDNEQSEMAAAVIPYLKDIKDAKLNCQLQKIDDFFGVCENGSQKQKEQNRYNRYLSILKEVEAYEAKHGKEPRPTILKDLFFDISDPDTFTSYMALRSIEGQKQYVATDRPTLAGRMTGAKSKKIIDDSPEMTELFSKYNNRYRMDKIINKLFKRGLIKSILRIPKHSKFYLSTKLEAEKLGEAVANQKLKRDIKKQNDIALKAFNEITTSI